MTSNTFELVRSSWSNSLNQRLDIAEQFYARLFEINPKLRSLFDDRMSNQRDSLVEMLNYLIMRLDDIESLIPDMQVLAHRHAQYGVTEKDYDVFGEALLWSLDHIHGSAFTEELRQAWSDVYGLLAMIMKDAARA